MATTIAAATLSTVLSQLDKAQEITLQAASHPEIDPETRKTLEDINALLISAQQLGKSKQIEGRLQKISEESQKVLKAAQEPGVSSATIEAAENINGFMNSWRPLFYLLLSERDFRRLILGSTRIIRSVVYSYIDINATADEIAETLKNKGETEMTEEEWVWLVEDIQRVMLLAKEPVYREGIERIFFLLEMLQKKTVPDNETDENISRIFAETEGLVASYSGRVTLEQFKYHLQHLILQIQLNPQLQSYLFELKSFILKTRTEEEIQSEELKAQIKELSHTGRELMRKLGDKQDLILLCRSVDRMIENFKNEEFLQILRQHAGIVQSDISYIDSQGTVQVDTDMLSILRSALLPVLSETLKSVPIPKIYRNDQEREFWLDKVFLSIYDIIPQNIQFLLESDSEVSTPSVEDKETHSRLVIRLDKLLIQLNDIEFYYCKYNFPYFEEHGKVSFREAGEGARLTFTYTLTQGPQDTVPRISDGYASFDISDISIEFDKGTLNHPLMVPMLTQWWKIQIRDEIEKGVEKNLNEFLEKLRDRIIEALTEKNRKVLSGHEATKLIESQERLNQSREILE